MSDAPESIRIPEAVVYYESWQMDCCGMPFEVGGPIEFTVGKAHCTITHEKLPDLPHRTDFIYEGHGNWRGGQQYCLQGIVKRIFIEYCTFRKGKGFRYANKPFYVESDKAHRFMPDIGDAEYQGFIIVVSDAVISKEEDDD